MEKGLSKYWTPQAEEYYQRVIDSCKNFAEQGLIMLMRDLMKYDGRSKEGRRSRAKARLRLATATDDDLAAMVVLEAMLAGPLNMDMMEGRLKDLEKARADIRQKGIKRSALECR